MKLILCLVSKSSMTFKCVTEVLAIFDNYMQSTLANIHNKLEKIENAYHIPTLSVVLEEIHKSRQCISSLNTKYKIKNSLTQHNLFINPIEIVLGEREEVRSQNGALINNVTVKDKAYYIPIHSIIKNLFSDEKFATHIFNEKLFYKTADGVYSNYCDSSKFKQHGLFSDKTKICLRIQLFYDGMGTTNPLRGHASIHSVGVFYITFENLNDKYLPVILGPFIPMGDKHGALFVQLQMLVDIAYAPKLTDIMLDYFEELYEDHMLLYKKLYPEIAVKPKQHFLVHFKTIVKENGPMQGRERNDNYGSLPDFTNESDSELTMSGTGVDISSKDYYPIRDIIRENGNGMPKPAEFDIFLLGHWDQFQVPQLIPRKNYKVTRYSYVCVKHFADEDIDKGKKIVVGGKEDLIPYTKWVLKKGAVSKLFLKGPAEKKPCNESLNYSTPFNNKRKHCTNKEITDRDISDCMMTDAVTEEASLQTNLLIGEILDSNPPAAEMLSVHQCRESKEANQDMSDLIEPTDFNAKVNVQNSDASNLQREKDCLKEVINWEKELSEFDYPLNWNYNKDLTEENEFHIYNIDYEVNGVQVPKNTFIILPTIPTSVDIVKNSIAVVDELDIFCGVSLQKFAECNEQQKWQLTNSTKGFEHKGVWRSYNCTMLLESRPLKYPTEKKINSCLECRLFRDGLNKKIWNFNQTKVGNKLDKCRVLRAKAVRTCHRKSAMLKKVKIELNTLRTQLSQPTEEKFIEFIETLQPQAQVLLKAILRKSACKDVRGIRYDTEWIFNCLLLRIKSPKAYDHLRGDGKNGMQPLPSRNTINSLIREIPGTYGLNDFSIESIGRNMSGKPENLRRGSLVWDKMSVKKSLQFNKQRMKFDGLVDYRDINIKHKSEKLADHALVLMFRPYREKWFCGENVDFKHFKNRFLVDERNPLRMCHKLKHAHIFLNSWEKMTVKFTTREPIDSIINLFSESTARGFEYYREDLGLEEFKNTEPTEAVMRLLNNAFDVMNGRHIQESIGKENWESKCKILNELLEAIDMSEHMSKEANLIPFVSQTTIEALRLTLTSIIDLTNDLFDDN
ncbi:Uncharacterized protein APZ42_030095 [Daphnia magna]|uniref:THAP-type domain-containing protein n=1 Tax=Daphnia magna TaxID=35525 RepID=A0A164P251_9CRUS|nr:Uncharacterized protein APZ42_030095 [Daphnia magna]